MSQSKHTVGPWRVAEKNNGGLVIRGAGDAYIARVNQLTEMATNASLIAAAPDLLEALLDVPDPADFPDGEAYREAVNLWWDAVASPALSRAQGAS